MSSSHSGSSTNENIRITRQAKRQSIFDLSRSLTESFTTPEMSRKSAIKNKTPVARKPNKKQKKKCFKNIIKKKQTSDDTLVLNRSKSKKGKAVPKRRTNLEDTVVIPGNQNTKTIRTGRNDTPFKTPKKRKNSSPVKISNKRLRRSNVKGKRDLVCSTPIGVKPSDSTINFENETPIQIPCCSTNTLSTPFTAPCHEPQTDAETPKTKVQKIQNIVYEIKDLLSGGKSPEKPSETAVVQDKTEAKKPPDDEVIEINDDDTTQIVDLTSNQVTQVPIIDLSDTQSNTVINVDDLIVLDETGTSEFRQERLPELPTTIRNMSTIVLQDLTQFPPLSRTRSGGSREVINLVGKKRLKKAKRKNRKQNRAIDLGQSKGFTVIPTNKLNLNFTSTVQDSEFVTRAIMLDNESVRHSAYTVSPVKASEVGKNIYNPGSNKKEGLRLIVIDGSNVAIGHLNGRGFSCEGLKICIDYFLKRGHEVKAFVPQYRRNQNQSTNPALLEKLARDGFVIFTPSRRVKGRMVVPYDDRYIVQCAAERGGVIVSNDNYRDLLKENPTWVETIENRLLMWTWCGDMIMFPIDPCGRKGPTLDQFLRF